MSDSNAGLGVLASVKRGCRHTTRMKHVLITTGFSDHWETIEKCSPYRRCGTSYCNSCRVRHTREHANRLQRLWRDNYSSEDEARNDTRFVTTLNELCCLNITDIKGALTRGRRTFQGLKRSFPGLRIYGRFEIEVVDTDMAFSSEANPQKRLLLQDLNDGRSSFAHRDMALVHSHTLFRLGGHNPASVRAKLTKRYDARYAVNMKKLFDNKSVSDNISKLCHYMLKDRFAYNYEMSDYGSGKSEYIRDEALSFLIRGYMSQDIGIGRSLYWSKS